MHTAILTVLVSIEIIVNLFPEIVHDKVNTSKLITIPKPKYLGFIVVSTI